MYKEEVARRLVQILVNTKAMFYFRVDRSRHKEYLVVVIWIQEQCLDNVKQAQMMFKLETFF